MSFGKSRYQGSHTLIRVKNHQPEERSQDVLIEHYRLGLSQSLLEDARTTKAGRFLLELLAACDYAGRQGKPVMLHGKKKALGGYDVAVSVPIVTDKQPGPPPDFHSNGNGVIRTA